MRHELIGEIPRVNLVVNSNLCLEHPALKPLFWGFMVVQGHRCWYHWKALRQCLLR